MKLASWRKSDDEILDTDETLEMDRKYDELRKETLTQLVEAELKGVIASLLSERRGEREREGVWRAGTGN